MNIKQSIWLVLIPVVIILAFFGIRKYSHNYNPALDAGEVTSDVARQTAGPALRASAAEFQDRNEDQKGERSDGQIAPIQQVQAVQQIESNSATTNQADHPFSIPAIAATISPGQEDASSRTQPRYTKEQLEVYRCSNQMFEINRAIERWAAEHNGVIPNDLAELKNYIAPMMLVCPGAQPQVLSASWTAFDVKDITYLIMPKSRGAAWDFKIPGRGSPQSVTCLICPIHKTSTFNWVMPGGIPRWAVFQYSGGY